MRAPFRSAVPHGRVVVRERPPQGEVEVPRGWAVDLDGEGVEEQLRGQVRDDVWGGGNGGVPKLPVRSTMAPDM